MKAVDFPFFPRMRWSRPFAVVLRTLLVGLIVAAGGFGVGGEPGAQNAFASPGGDGAGAVFVLPVGPSREAEPGRPLTLFVDVANDTDEPQRLRATVRAPEGWRVVHSTDAVPLPSRSRQMHHIVLVPPEDAPAGTYEVHVVYTPEEDGLLQSPSPAAGPATVGAALTIRVPPRPNLELFPQAVPETASPDGYEGTFLLRNDGNVEQRVRLEVRDNVGWSLSVTPQRAVLLPGEERLVVAAASGFPAAPVPGVHRLEVTAVDEDDAEQRTHAAVRVPLLPGGISEEGSRIGFPLHGTLGLTLAGGSVGLSGSLYGQGSVGSEGVGQWTVDATRRGTFVSYASPDVLFAWGPQRMERSRLTGGPFWTTGVRLDVDGGPARAQWIAHGQDGGTVGLRILQSPADGVETGFNVVTSRRAGPLPVTLEAAFSPDDRWRVEAEFGRQDAGAETPAAEAAAFALSANAGRGDAATGRRRSTFSWQRTDPGYLGASGATEQLVLEHRTERGNAAWSGRWQKTLRIEETVDGGGETQERLVTGSYTVRTEDGWRSVHLSDGLRIVDGERRVRRQRWTVQGSNASASGGSLWWRIGAYRTTDETGVDRWQFPLQGNRRMPLGAGTLQLQFGTDLAGDGSSTWPVRAGLRWTARRDGLEMSVAASGHAGRETTARLEGSLARGGMNGHGWRSEAGIVFRSAGRELLGNGESFFRVTYDIPLELTLPLARDASKGSVEGRITDLQGRGVAGVVVRLHDEKVTTDEDGVYRFARIVPGDGFVAVDEGSIDPEFVLVPGPGQSVAIAAGQTAVADFYVAPAARLEVVLHPDASPPAPAENAEEAAFGPMPSGTTHRSPDAPVVVEVGNGVKTFRQRVVAPTGAAADGKATLSFGPLAPGRWTVALYGPSSSAHRTGEEPLVVETVELLPGETGRVSLTATRPRSRLHFMDMGGKGVLTLPGAEVRTSPEEQKAAD